MLVSKSKLYCVMECFDWKFAIFGISCGAFKRWPDKTVHCDKSILCLTAANVAAVGSAYEQKTLPESQPGIQGEGGIGHAEGWKTPADLAQLYDVHASQITTWRT